VQLHAGLHSRVASHSTCGRCLLLLLLLDVQCPVAGAIARLQPRLAVLLLLLLLLCVPIACRAGLQHTGGPFGAPCPQLIPSTIKLRYPVLLPHSTWAVLLLLLLWLSGCCCRCCLAAPVRLLLQHVGLQLLPLQRQAEVLLLLLLGTGVCIRVQPAWRGLLCETRRPICCPVNLRNGAAVIAARYGGYVLLWLSLLPCLLLLLLQQLLSKTAMRCLHHRWLLLCRWQQAVQLQGRYSTLHDPLLLLLHSSCTHLLLLLQCPLLLHCPLLLLGRCIQLQGRQACLECCRGFEGCKLGAGGRCPEPNLHPSLAPCTSTCS
jgi:hypothetical protein